MKNSLWKKLREEPEAPRHVNTFYGLIIVALVFVCLVYIPFVMF